MPEGSIQDEQQGALTGDEAARLTDQLAGLTRSGLPLGPGLAALGSELPRGRLRSSVLELARDIEQGMSLKDALEKQEDRIPPHLHGLVLGGLNSGQLGDILGRFSSYMGVGAELERKLWLSLAYPIASIVVALILFVFVQVVLVGMFETIFRDFGIPLPSLTVGMVLMSRGMRQGWPVLAIIGIALAVGLLLQRFLLSAAQRRSLATRVPVIGKVWKYISLAEFCHLLALLLESHLQLPQALRVTGESVQDADMDRACQRMAERVEDGSSLGRAMAEQPGLPLGLARMLRWTGGQNAAADILHMSGEMFEARARNQAVFAGTVMAVLAAIFVLWGVFSVIAGLMLPLVTLFGKLSG